MYDLPEVSSFHWSLTAYTFELNQMKESFGDNDLQKPTQHQVRGESKMPEMFYFLSSQERLADMMIMVLGLVTVIKNNSY